MTLQRDKRAAELEALIDTAGTEIVSTDVAQIDFALEGSLRLGKGRHPAGLNFVNKFAYALARAQDELPPHKNKDFGQADWRLA
jgi:ribonuclease VapC